MTAALAAGSLASRSVTIARGTARKPFKNWRKKRVAAAPAPLNQDVENRQWKPFQVTHSENRPTVASPLTQFNLVPCNQGLEVAFTKFVSPAPDMTSFARSGFITSNAGGADFSLPAAQRRLT